MWGEGGGRHLDVGRRRKWRQSVSQSVSQPVSRLGRVNTKVSRAGCHGKGVGRSFVIGCR